jgi:hypothetical protein
MRRCLDAEHPDLDPAGQPRGKGGSGWGGARSYHSQRPVVASHIALQGVQDDSPDFAAVMQFDGNRLDRLVVDPIPPDRLVKA